MPYIPTENHLPKKDVSKFCEWEFCPNTNLQPSTSPPPSSETTPSLATVNDGHHHPQQPSMAHNNPSTPRNDKKDAWAPRQQVNERGCRFTLVTARWQLTANDDISRRSSFASMLNEVHTISPPPPYCLLTLEPGATSPPSATWQPNEERRYRIVVPRCLFFHDGQRR
jgi:hypothetical protein